MGTPPPSPLRRRGRKKKVSGNRDLFLSPFGGGLRGRTYLRYKNKSFPKKNSNTFFANKK